MYDNDKKYCHWVAVKEWKNASLWCARQRHVTCLLLARPTLISGVIQATYTTRRLETGALEQRWFFINTRVEAKRAQCFFVICILHWVIKQEKKCKDASSQSVCARLKPICAYMCRCFIFHRLKRCSMYLNKSCEESLTKVDDASNNSWRWVPSFALRSCIWRTFFFSPF